MKIENDISLLKKKYLFFKNSKKQLDLTRGRPSSEQLNLSGNLENILKGDFFQDKVDIRNYGLLEGLPSARKLAGWILNSDPKNILVNGTSSLTLLGHYLQSLIFHGDGKIPWKDLRKISFLCPVPGYDRHFSMLEKLGIKMIPVPLTGNGPDLELIKNLLETDETIKGILCVPKHSNPTGETYSQEVIEELAKIKKEDFKIIFDNAYAVHDFSKSKKLPNIEQTFIKNNSHKSLVMLGSTSKISLAGSGLAFMSLSPENMSNFIDYFSKFSLGSDKVNQARHVRIFNSKKALSEHMNKLAKIIKPKFDLVQEKLSTLPTGLAKWTKPTGGYFISFDSLSGRASKIHKLCNEAGLKLTPLGATFPYGKDLDDKNIRLAPTQVELDELEDAMELFCICVLLAEAN
jgi:DNA-binding transcriptional MocR family regulator